MPYPNRFLHPSLPDLKIHRRVNPLTFVKTVIPGEPTDCGRGPESRKLAENQNTLDPGSRPAPRDLAGMTNCDIVSEAGIQKGLHSGLRLRGEFHRPLDSSTKQAFKPSRISSSSQLYPTMASAVFFGSSHGAILYLPAVKSMTA